MREWAEDGGKKKILLIGAVVIIVVGAAVLLASGGGGNGGNGGGLAASFSPSTSSPKVGNTVTFTDSSTGDPVSWSWDFGDGATSTSQNPSHQYSEVGTYTVKLTVTYADGETKSYEKQIVVIEVTIPTEAYMVYSDAGLAAGAPADVWVWSGADWGLEAPPLVDGNYVVPDAPEGTTCYAVTSGSGSGNYVGWGVFLGIFDYSTHVLITPDTVDLSSYENLEFWVKTSVDLKIELQQDNAQGKKSTARFISNYGWDQNLPDVWQKVTISASAITNVDLTKVFCPFMVTGVGSGITFYVDAVMWVPLPS